MNRDRPSPAVPPPAALLLAAAALLLLPPSAAAQDCADCHEETVAEASVHAVLDCADCHSGYDEDLHPEGIAAGEALCADCHDAGESVAESAHADLVGCQDCHGAAHEILAVAELESPASPLRQVVTCGDCHETEDRLIDGYLTSVHGRALLKSGLIFAPHCTSCHGTHDILPVSDSGSKVSYQRVPETCGECHRFILDDWLEQSAHGLGWKAGNRDAPVCVTCHASHEVKRPTGRGERLEFPENCGDCHSGPYGTYRDSFHGQATDLGFVAGAICSDCHTPHKNLAAADPRSSVNPQNLAATCGQAQCHPKVTDEMLTFDPHADPSDPERSRPVYFVWLFMTSLLIGVFSFFGVHDLLYLQRSIVGWKRGELAALRGREGPWIRRFSKLDIRVHKTVIISFLVLAATGLPLKYHFTDWAQTLTAIPGTVALFRIIHRFAAVVTFGYFFFHVAHILYRAFVRREPGIFWGWKSMIPRAKDFRDLWYNLRYFLYRERHPRLDRWTYWEKFDYFAVFWGVPIIGGSGLLLWFPDVFTRILPGWILNIAYVIHSDEALLATAFIFVFHFFHTHLRPETFPMDPVIFVGSMPLKRFREERPVEYERLVAAEELEQHLVEPPSDYELRRAFTFGAVAVTTGILLVVGIVTAMIFHGFH